MSTKTKKIWRFLGWILVLLLAVAGALALVHRQWLLDWYQGLNYAPTSEMSAIRTALDLTDQGTFLFNALTPSLETADEFNQNCRDDVSETAVLGCYGAGQIHVYDVAAPEFAGIREVTTAHELLHGAWERLSAEDRAELQTALAAVLDDHSDPLASELAVYDEAARTEEIYVRAGTEIRDLPEALERHYAIFFQDRAKLVDFYDSYVAVFKQTKARADALEQEITSLKSTIEAEVSDFEAAAGEFQTAVTNFNRCANTTNCFTSQSEFQRQRSALLSQQQTLLAQNDHINNLISAYNAKIDEYNQNAARSQELQAMINSTAPQVSL